MACGIQADAAESIGRRLREPVQPSGPLRTLVLRWKTRRGRSAPAPEAGVRALVDALGVSPTTASVLVRRGYGEPVGGARRSSRARCRATTRSRSATCARRSSRSGPRSRPARGSACTATTTPTASARPSLAVLLLRELGADPDVAPAVAVRGGLRPREPDARAARRRRRRASCSPSTAGSRRVAEVDEARRLGLEIVVTDHHRPRADTFPACPVVAPLKGDVSRSPGSAAPASSGSSPRRCSAPATRSSSATSTSSRSRPSPTSSRSLDENRALARLGLRRLAQTQKPGLLALMRVAGVDPAACEEGAIGFRLAPRINAAGRLGRPEAALELLLTDDPREATRLAEDLEVLNRERQGVEERILRAAIVRDRVVARGAPPSSRLRRRGRGLARGRDRHRRVAPRRALRPAGRADRRRRRQLEGLGPLDRRRSTCTARSPRARSTSSASAATARPPG